LTPSFYRFDFKPLSQVSPASVHDALGQVPVVNHVSDMQIFDGDHVVGCNQCARQLVQKIFPPVLRPLVLPLQQHHSLATAIATFLPTRYSPLNHAQLGLVRPIPLRVLYLVPVARGEQTRNTYVDSNAPSCCGKRLCLDLT
jgi:hypothetical protein